MRWTHIVSVGSCSRTYVCVQSLQTLGKLRATVIFSFCFSFMTFLPLTVFLSLTSLDLIRPLYMYVYASPSLLYADHRLSYYLYIRERERNSVEVKVKTQCSGAASSSSLVSSSLCFFFIVCMHFICTCTCVYTRALHITSFFVCVAQASFFLFPAYNKRGTKN